jgi:hypothetical protein
MVAYALGKLQTMLPVHIFIEECGYTVFLLIGSLRVIFRSSHTGRYPGFSASIICFDPAVHEDCSTIPTPTVRINVITDHSSCNAP